MHLSGQEVLDELGPGCRPGWWNIEAGPKVTMESRLVGRAEIP